MEIGRDTSPSTSPIKDTQYKRRIKGVIARWPMGCWNRSWYRDWIVNVRSPPPNTDRKHGLVSASDGGHIMGL